MNQLASFDFYTDERVTWVEIEGIPLKMWSKNTFNRVASKWGVLLDVDDKGDEHFHRKQIYVTNVEDLEGDSDGEIVPKTKFEEDFSNQKGEQDSVRQDIPQQEVQKLLKRNNLTQKNSKNDVEESICSGHFKKSEVSKSDGSILQLIEDLVKVGETMGSDWMPNGKKLLLILVYAPQELYEKKMLCDYLSLVMSKWEGEVVIMGDFNEVHNKSKRFGTLFNRHGADVFNRFISNTGFEEFPLKGCSFTWCHRSAIKMSKLDRFLFQIASYAHVRIFLQLLLIDSWKDAPIIESNALVRMMKKIKRTEVVNLLQEVEKKNSLEAAQKEKIKWAIEGDKNSKYYHGVINKKRNQLGIRGILVEGTWIDSPFLVKISKEEIKKAVWDYGIDKSPGPDRFTFGFYRRYWKLIKNDVVDAVTCFFHQGLFLKGVQWCKKKKKQSLVFKVDFKKAYDSVRWDYLDDIMRKVGFGEKWCLKQGDLLSPFLFILVMESLHISFQRVVGVDLFKEDDKVKQAAAKIGCNTLKTPFSYLGSKVGGFPKKVLHRMEFMRSHFFNGAELSSKKSVWVKWKHALASKYKGGLGVKSCYPSLWLDIIHEVEMFKSRGIDLVSLIHSKLGNGVNTSFLEVAWHEGSPFKSIFPRLYAPETQKKINVASKLSHSGLDVSFRRPPKGGVEIQQFEHMKEKVEGCILADMMDR
uniref:RNA-directed DNA polymerase, eukaryota, reverse transcriptase zinc-binding domain protein n=1 Tax=Tanacetum cinerariifolium TaxID=118510 RepID=A0A6L2JRG3_TANCI|nr:RNA-directed DNA polymerase, eukaryota, reverse transcriptase zinc-binding domain protein [Tanacetum cinerariifolium]